MKKPEYIIVHCSDSEWGSAREIRKWHQEKGWTDIGYHFVVLNGKVLPDFTLSCLEGSIELGRPMDGDPFIEDNEIGAHTLGYNDRSIGVCGIAKAAWTKSQLLSLVQLLRGLSRQFGIPAQNILGHCETESGKKEGKTCPNTNMSEIRAWVKDTL